MQTTPDSSNSRSTVKIRSRAARLLCSALAMTVAGAAAAQSEPRYPTKTVRIVTAEAGGGNDFFARIVAQELTSALGQQVIVENRGGSGVIPIEIVSKAAPDGHTLLVSGSALWLLPYLQSVTYDPLRDFVPLGAWSVAPLLLVVHPTVSAKSVKELIALAKARPGELNYASGIAGSVTHLAGEVFKAIAGVNVVRVVYKGGGPALAAMLGGEVQLMFAPGSAGPHVAAGRLRALAVTTAQPSALFPGVPTVAAEGLPGYETAGLNTLFAPAKMPVSLIRRLNGEAKTVLNRAEVKDRFLKSGFELVTSTPEEAAATVKADMQRTGKVIKEAGIRTE